MERRDRSDESGINDVGPGPRSKIPMRSHDVLAKLRIRKCARCCGASLPPLPVEATITQLQRLLIEIQTTYPGQVLFARTKEDRRRRPFTRHGAGLWHHALDSDSSFRKSHRDSFKVGVRYQWDIHPESELRNAICQPLESDSRLMNYRAQN